MSNIEPDPSEQLCGEDEPAQGLEIIDPREVPLGGPRAMQVRRTLPARGRTMIGPWCFVDHYGPDDVSETGGMNVPPHPHTGLQTVSWLFTGRIDHEDSAGHKATVTPGSINLMTAGRGISHTEYSTPDTTVLHGAQLWLALPDASRDTDPGFEAYTPEPLNGEDWDLRVFLGEFAGERSPVHSFHPVLGAELVIDATEHTVEVEFDLNEDFEHGVLLDEGKTLIQVDPDSSGPRSVLKTAQLAHIATGARKLKFQVPQGEQVVLLILGGTPFGEQITMWWNFVGRSHDEIVAYRDAWQAAIDADDAPPAADADPHGRFPNVVADSHNDGALPAPKLPNVRLKPRP